MASLIIVSGCPGAGKTTLSASISKAHPQGLHLTGDTFYGFPAHFIEPTKPESHAQNTTIVRATARAASAFLEGGYLVVLDGIFGPWFLPVVMAELPPDIDASYLVLRVPEAEALRRVRERQGVGASARVRPTVAAFAELGEYESHVISTLGRSEEEVLRAAESGLREGHFRLRR